jgi:hypothetical protein
VNEELWLETAGWGNGLGVRELSAAKGASTEAQGIVGIRYQTTNREDYNRLSNRVP